MGLLNVGADLISREWRIVSVDPELELELKGQFPPAGGVEDNASPRLSSGASAGSSSPSVQWVHGGLRTVSFRSEFVARHQLQDHRKKERILVALRSQDPNLGRGPRVRFTWGSTVIVGFVTTCRIAKSGYWSTGFPKVIAFNMEITEAPDPIELELDDLSPEGETQWITLGQGDTFETLGARYLGRALRGELVRRINPGQGAGEVPGDRVRVFERDHPAMAGDVRPTSAPFSDRTRQRSTWQPIVEELVEARVRGLPWALLPEVLAGEVG